MIRGVRLTGAALLVALSGLLLLLGWKTWFTTKSEEEQSFSLVAGKEAGDIPVYRARVAYRDGMLQQLRAPGVPFGLDLGAVGITDGGLKELAALQQLQMLDLTLASKITNAGLKELAP